MHVHAHIYKYTCTSHTYTHVRTHTQMEKGKTMTMPEDKPSLIIPWLVIVVFIWLLLGRWDLQVLETLSSILIEKRAWWHSPVILALERLREGQKFNCSLG